MPECLRVLKYNEFVTSQKSELKFEVTKVKVSLLSICSYKNWQNS